MFNLFDVRNITCIVYSSINYPIDCPGQFPISYSILHIKQHQVIAKSTLVSDTQYFVT